MFKANVTNPTAWEDECSSSIFQVTLYYQYNSCTSVNTCHLVERACTNAWQNSNLQSLFYRNTFGKLTFWLTPLTLIQQVHTQVDIIKHGRTYLEGYITNLETLTHNLPYLSLPVSLWYHNVQNGDKCFSCTILLLLYSRHSNLLTSRLQWPTANGFKSLLHGTPTSWTPQGFQGKFNLLTTLHQLTKHVLTGC